MQGNSCYVYRVCTLSIKGQYLPLVQEYSCKVILTGKNIFIHLFLHLYNYDLDGYYYPGQYITIFLKNTTPLCSTPFPYLCSFYTSFDLPQIIYSRFVFPNYWYLLAD